jgi:tetratricopeptide (TPR) repeat protein
MFHHLHQRAPESVVSLMDLANNYLEQHNYVGAIDWLQRAVNLKPDSAEILLKLAWSQLLVGKPDRALEAYSSCLALDSGILNTQKQSAMLGRGNALRVLGRGAEAISAYQSCLGEEGIFANACWSLASMRTYEFSDSELDRMMTQCARKDNSSRVTTHLDFAIGKALDDREEYGAAWARYVSGNARQRNETRFDGVDFESNIDDLIGTYTAEFCNRKPVAPADDAISIFILGLPRSGSTLLEQILASHSQVEATTELPYLREFATPLNRNSSPANSFAVTDLQEDAIKALGEKYLAATSAHRLERKPWFIDKLPANFPYVGFIHRVLPQAIIIDARRNPLDTCIANFRQLYAQGKEFSYDLVELSEMYLQYVRLMEHWDTVLPGRVLTMRYEAVVDDTQQQIAQMLKHCGLEWEVACLDFRSTSRTFSTASSEQVRQPIYTSSIGYWRHYEENLTDLIESLESVIAGSQTDAV